MKRIIFTVTNDLTYDRRMQRICHSLATHGFEVTLVGRKLKNSKPIVKTTYAQKRVRCWFNEGKLFYMEYNFRLLMLLLFTKAETYSAVDLDTILPVFLVAELKGKKKVFDAHEYFTEVPEVVNRPIVKRSWELVAKLMIPKADLAYTVSKSLANQLQSVYGKQFLTIRNVPYQSSELPNNNLGSYLLYQGALNEGRGLEQIIEAMKDVTMPLKIAGEGDLSNQLRQQVKDLGLGDKIEFLGFVTPDKLPDLTSNAFLGFNLLSSTGLSYYYSLANKYFDYVNHRIPQITMNFPEYANLNKQHEVAVLIDSLAPNLIANTVTALVQDKNKYKLLKNNCLNASCLFIWEKEEQKLLKLYSEIG